MNSTSTEIKISNINCPLCGSEKSQFIRKYLGKDRIFKNGSVVKCEQCAGVFLAPRPLDNELSQYYNQGKYWGHVLNDTPFDNPVFHHQAKARYDFINNNMDLNEGCRILDVGAGFGVLEKVFQENKSGLLFFAVEPDPKGIKFLKSLGVECRAELGGYQGEKFDLVILSHILEHMNDPRQFLSELKEMIVPGGQLFIEVPNQDHDYKISLEPHIVFYGPGSLGGLVKNMGFTNVKVETCGRIRSFQKEVLAQDEKNNRGKKYIPFKNILRMAKSKLLGKKKSVNPATIKDSYLCSEYGGDRIWLRCLAKVG